MHSYCSFEPRNIEMASTLGLIRWTGTGAQGCVFLDVFAIFIKRGGARSECITLLLNIGRIATARVHPLRFRKLRRLLRPYGVSSIKSRTWPYAAWISP